MELRLLKTFYTIVQLGSFHRAAEALQYSQPTVSVQLKKLETELGVKLLERTKAIKLTSEGHLVYEHAESLLRNYTNFNSMLTDISNGEAGIVAIGAAEPSVSRLLPDVIHSFLAKKPKIQIKVSVGTNLELMQMVLNDQVDLALCHQPEPHLLSQCGQPGPEVELEFNPLLTESFMLLLPENHPLAGRDVIFLKDLINDRFLVTPASCPFRIKIESMASRKLGGGFKNAIEVASITAIKYFVQAGLGITFVPEIDAAPVLSGTVVKHVADLEKGPEVGILAKRHSIVKGTVNEALFAEFKHVLMKLGS
ncbi:LysR family transcriptional regulator [Paenibacillaceae bacterium]|nr:LysR family transcriptional regulator [Paenibacillaceae bacterium]